MFKKLAIYSLAGAAGLGAIASTGAWTYVKTGVTACSDTVRDSVPIEWEIKRARQMIEDLEPEIKKNLQIVAREEVAVRRLGSEIDTKESQLAKSREDIFRLKSDLESKQSSTKLVKFVYAGRTYSEQQVRDDLENRFKQFKVHEQTTDKLTEVLDARQRNLDAAKQKLDEMLSAKRELEVEIENLQARLTMVEVAQTSNPVSIDDSHLSSTRQLLDEIRTRIDVAEQMSTSDGGLQGTIPLDSPESSDVLEDLAAYFGQAPSDVEVVVINNN